MLDYGVALYLVSLVYRVFRLSDNPCPKLFRQGRRRLQSNVETRETEARVYGEEDNRMTLHWCIVLSQQLGA